MDSETTRPWLRGSLSAPAKVGTFSSRALPPPR